MLAGVFKRIGVLEIEDRPEPKNLAEDEILLEIEGAGVCGSDLHILSDPPGFRATEGLILGHEMVARIIDRGRRVTAFETGTSVIVDPNLKCGLCAFCRKGLPNQCKNGTTIGVNLDGGFARFVTAPQKALHPIRVLVDVVNHRLKFARSGGISKTVNPKETNLHQYIADATGGEYADVVCRCSGKPIRGVPGCGRQRRDHCLIWSQCPCLIRDFAI